MGAPKARALSALRGSLRKKTAFRSIREMDAGNRTGRLRGWKLFRTPRAPHGDPGISLPAFLAGALVLFCAMIPLTLCFLGAGAGFGIQAGAAGYMDPSAVEAIRTWTEEQWFEALREERTRLLGEGAGRVLVRFNPAETGDGDSGVRLVNWNDVLAVWVFRAGRPITPEDAQDVADIFFAMNAWQITADVQDEPGTVRIDVVNSRVEDTDVLFGFSAEDIAEMRSWINPSSGQSSLWIRLLGSPVDAPDAFTAGWLNVDLGSAVQIILQEAQRRQGWVYSQERRTESGYADCSSLAAACYRAVGISFGSPWPTAAEIARWCDANSCRVPASDRQPGDLILWGGRSNGRYLGVYHVAVYAGDGMMWEAAPSAGGVVYRAVSVQNPGRIIFYARPCAAAGFAWSSSGDLPAGLEGARPVTLQTTGYCEACDTIWGEGLTASGTYPQRGTVATSRTKQFPFGTKLYIPGYGYGTVEDTGGFADGTIDLYLGHRSVCTCGDDWGRRTLTVYVLD